MSDPARPHGETPVLSVLDRLRAKRASAESVLPARIPRLARDGGAWPLSDGQERLWFIDRMLPGNAAYNITAAVDMEGPLDLAAFDAALTEIVRRHEALRTSFPALGDQPAQVVSPVALSPLHLVDLDGLADGRRIAGRIAGELAAAPFDLAGGALLRAGLLRLGPEEHRLVVVLHHIVSDGWSLRILLRETRLLYQAFLERRPSPLPELPVQYADFAAWQRRWLAGDAAARQLAWWKQELGERPAVLQLPADRPRPAVQSLRGRSLPLVLPPGLSAEIGALTRSAEVTPFVTLLAAFQALLHRLSGQPEILVGFPIANRKRPEIQDLIGFFVNTLAIRARFSTGLCFRDLLRGTHEAALGAHANQELPFGRLVKELQPERQTSHSPLVQVAFAFQNLEAASGDLPGLRLTPRDVPRESAMFDLQLNLKEEPRGFAGEIEHATDLFDAATVSRWAGHLATLLAAAVADPERRIADLPLMSAAEAQQIREANDTAVRYAAGGRCLHELIAEQAAATPDALSVVDEGGDLTYRELAARSSRLARHLVRLGVGPEVRVGICIERSLDLMVGLLGVLEAGGAYVPFDPSYPRERLAYMLADSDVRVLLAQPATLPALPDLEAAGVHVVLLSADRDDPGMAAAPAVHPGNLAYVIYTSGSTGRPKGVMNTHAGIVNRLLWMQAQYGLAPGDRVLQKTPVSFDVSVWELFWPLLTGACLVMARPGGHQDGAYLVRTIAEQGITTLHFVPSMLAVFLETPALETPERAAVLRRVMASGEALPPALVERYFSRLGAPLHNLYGPTEAAVDVTFWPCDPEDRRGLVPIGRPVANTAIHLLDRDFNPVPLGVAGELHIGGVQVARGYLGRPDLTAERFVPDPAGDGERLYATGDLARRLPGGEIDYLGRIDHQVKIRGIRIELGEIETVLAAHPGVREAVIVVRSETAGARLVAYVVADAAANRGELVNDLRRSCREALPEAMMPSAFVVLDALPLTPNGKVDRRALPAPPGSGPAAGESPGPRTPAEEIVAAIWSEVLGVERIGVEESFFDLGGHSLLANQVVSRLRRVFHMELPLRDFFAAPTVKDLARWLAAGEGGAALPAPPLVARPRRDGEPLSFAQERLWFLHQLDPESTAYHVPIAVRLEGALAPEALASALEGVVHRHEALRTAFALRAEGPVQVISPAAAWTLPVVDLSGLGAARREAEMQRLALEEVSRPFDLTRGALLRTSLVRLRPRESVLLAVMHHIVSDEWSMAVLWRETAALYRSAVERRPADLPELPIQYSDFAQWQRELLSGEVLETQLSYWRRQLAGAPTLLELPTDRPRPRVQRFHGGRQGFSLPAETTRRFRELGRREGATPFMTLLAAFDALLHRYSRQEDVVVGFPIAGRSRVETEGLIGLFINTLALRAAVPGASSWLALLRQVREVSLAGYAHHDLPFEKLVAELDIERSLAHAPLFQTLLVMQNIPVLGIAVPDLTIEPLDLGTGTAKFDLVLNVGETAGGLAGRWLYNSELFEAATVARMSGHFEALLAGILADPGQRIEDLPLLGEAERQQMVVGWNDTAVLYPEGNACLHQLIEAQAARTPEAPAVSFEGETLTYRELERRSRSLAGRLRALGVGPETLVGVCAERSTEMVVALLAILKAGGAYVPLDPDYPADRLAFMLEDAAVPVLLTQARLVDRLPAHGARTVLLDGPAETAAGTGGPAAGLTADPDTAAYAIFTSGSTGRPKGVVNTHRGIVNRILWMQAQYGLTPGDAVLQKTPFSFDVSVWELFWPLVVGARLVVARPGGHQDPAWLAEAIAREGITTLHFVPSMLQVFVEQDGLDGLAGHGTSLRRVMASGEALPAGLAARFFARMPRGVELHNLYGPTEAAVDVTYHACRPGEERVPIGRPVANTRILLLDRNGRPVPLGVAGELHIGGVQVARGYLRRPDLTAERFVPDPDGDGERLYRTGDLARRLPDGEVEYLGRIDHQVKIRGFRIELGDIEAALLSHPAVRAAVVLARAQPSGALDRRLVAYLVAEMAEVAEEIAPAALRTFLQKSLPEYMVPSAFVALERLPLTASGKVDRKALPAPEADAAAGAQDFVAPRTDLERSLCELCAEVLGLAPEQVGVQDSFFEIGGDSIRAAILVNRLQKKLGQIVHVVALFDHPTVAELAAYLTSDYPEAVAGLWGLEVRRGAASAGRIGTAQVALLREIIPPLSPAPAPEPRNPPAVFVLSPPRSGSTLLRVMLGGHPRLFAPPELELLSFTGMAERRAAFSGRNAFWLEGLLRTVMEALHCSADEAKALVERCEDEGLPTRLVYRRLQQWIGARTLVDKTPSYALSRDALERAETDFDGALYIHLIRHPNAVIHSFEEARLDQVFFPHAHPFTRRELAELVWTVSHQNIVDFLALVPAQRQHWLRFEELVRDPVAVLSGLCEFLGIDFHPDMAKPYKETGARMTDGLHAQSRMLGDVKFHQHAGVEAGAAERWRQQPGVADLGEPTHQLASLLGYDTRPEEEAPQRVPPPLVPADRSRPLPLSFAQQRLWFLDQLAPGGSAYNIPSSVRLVGRLDVPALAASLGEVVRRHETLRTTFGKEAGEPVQRIAAIGPIAAGGPVALPVVDLRGLPAPARESEARSLAGAEAERAFDLARGPLLRAHLVALSGEEQVLLLTLHHIVSDGWSQGVLVQELATLYESFSQGRPSPLPDLPIQYADFACWQRQWLAGETLDAEIAWWRERLAGVPPLLELPTDRPRPAVQTFAGADCAVSVPGPLVAELKAVARSRDATLFMALLAAFQALLCRYSGQTDVPVGTPAAGRNHFETEKLIGLFVNTLVLRTDLSEGPTFSGLTARVRETALAAYLHQDLPFEMLVEHLRPERSLSHSPLFQVMLVLQNAPQGALTVPGLQFEAFEVPGTTAKFDLTLTLVETPSGLQGALNYNRDLFEEATVRRLARSWTHLLQSAVTEPESRVLEVPWLAPEERHQLAVDWNDTALRLPSEGCFHRFIEAQAARAPEAAAVRFEGRELTYADLNARANRLARHLQNLGVGPDRAVGICAGRSLELCVGLLAILKAGGAYLPLDPSLPTERLAFMVEDVASSLGMPVLLTQSRLLEQAARWTAPGTAVVLLDGAPGEMASGDGNLEAAPAADNLAYVIYTSGSTGRPKGVMVPHRGLINYLLWSAEAYGASAGTGSLVHSALGFDLTVTSLFVPLLGGRTVELVPEGDGVEELAAALLASRDLTLLKLTPAHLEALRGCLPAEEVAGRVRMLVIGGEALQGESLGFWLEHAPGTRLINEYGPTETVVGCCVYEVPPGPSARGSVSIGRPVANTHMVVLDRWLELLPLGAAGELYIGGAGVTRGYLGRPELTAERFVPDAFGEAPGARLYRTGDLARYLPDGRLQYLGRTDHQVKIRGFRIELGEIEAALAELPGVRQAVVLVREGPQGDRRLAAWIVAGEEPLAPDDLRQRLRSRLPEHMVPVELGFLDSLPLTPTGKVDRRALPASAPGVRTGRAPAAPPRDEVEHRLAEIWAEVLGLEGVGVDESFFELGGHSLSAVRLMARIEDRFGQALPLSAVFQAVTPERMASLLRTDAPAIASTRSVVVKLQGGSRRPFFCVHPIGGNVFCYVPLARALGPGQPLYGLQTPDLSSAPAETLDTIEEMSRHYIEAMREVQPAGPYRLGGWSMGAVVAFEMARQLRRAGEEVELVAMLDAPAPGAHRRAGDLDRSSILAGFARDLTGALLPVPVEELRQLDHERQLARVLEWAKETGALPPGETLGRLAGLFATFERNLAALSRYEPGPYPGRIGLFRASDTVAQHPDSGWVALAHEGAAIHEIPGDHYSIVRSPALLAERLKAFLGPG